MKLETAQRIELIERLRTQHSSISDYVNLLSQTLDISPDSNFYSILYSTFDIAMKVSAELLNDNGDWLSWYCYENKWGASGYEAGYTGSGTRKICSHEDLLWLIDYGNEPDTLNNEQDG